MADLQKLIGDVARSCGLPLLLKFLDELHSHATQHVDVLFDLALLAIQVGMRGVAPALAQCTQPAFDVGKVLLQFGNGAHVLTLLIVM
jgi:hypothetical protein